MTLGERDKLNKLPIADLRRRVALAEAVIADGIRECAAESRIREVIRQREVIVGVIRDRERKQAKQPDGIIIGLKTLTLFARRQ